MVIFSQPWDGNETFQGTIAIDGFSMVLLPLNHHHWMFLHWLTIDIDDFFNGFPQILVRWSTMVLARLKDLKKLAIATYPIFWQMHFMIKKGDKWTPQIISEFPGHFAELKLFGLLRPHFATIQRHHHLWMEWLVATIGFNGFLWFWGSATFGFNGFRGLSTSGATVEW